MKVSPKPDPTTGKDGIVAHSPAESAKRPYTKPEVQETGSVFNRTKTVVGADTDGLGGSIP